MVNSPITTHVLDTANGVAAQGVRTSLHVLESQGSLDGPWLDLGVGATDKDGRCSQLMVKTDGAHHSLVPGTYRLTFATKEYYESKGSKCFFPYAQVIFEVSDPPQNHYHIPLLLSNYSYSTYRGT
ncbi:hypothetical protein BASA50_007080 [Batrachochytrium salamandrivorans]|uniref:5-hydroxyisourate hydrolase n=1 Tax=Batrachochytrium salamandrivorans TaxID=1357716 RepID=A0ABQ8F829_9FUNG|nr:hypothetical protein BASA60_000587 [Batrachochytrium salamandrivorans]KAH6577985.1 hypothetical protein BASA62_000549 [Batrachochytrium salamandrivorans]KAH6580965.1 hypothetical protein BASA60_002640 [Batrachochytrium salamandrivorans]KAH6593854.1 hypothetical protein BASA50_007080 [Batrachochytrium salamandrivorans]KAH6597064.1 hypothetical protein BASA61_003276 [Batrachochytrium salamandrivorans]